MLDASLLDLQTAYENLVKTDDQNGNDNNGNNNNGDNNNGNNNNGNNTMAITAAIIMPTTITTAVIKQILLLRPQKPAISPLLLR